MRVIFTCGGTAGHVNPAIALAGYMREKEPDTAVLFVGTPTGMERELTAKAGYDYAAVEVSSFQRKLNAEGIRHNLHTLRGAGLLRAAGTRHPAGFQARPGGGHRRLRQLSHGEGGG